MKRNCVIGFTLFPSESRLHAWYAHALAWEVSEKTPDVLAGIRSHSETALVRQADNSSWAILESLRNLAKVGDLRKIGEITSAVAELMNADKENLQAPRAFSAMAMGDFNTVFDCQKYVLRSRVLRRNAHHFRFALSLSEMSPDDRVLILSEPGVGDELRFSSLYPDIVALFPQAVFSCDERIKTLLERSFPFVAKFVPVRRYHRERISKDDLPIIGDLPDIELAKYFNNELWNLACSSEVSVVVPAPCLAADFRPDRNSFENAKKLFLKPDQELVAKWRAKLSGHANKLVVGITWSSMYTDYQRIENYLTNDEVERILSVPDAVFVNCQYDAKPEQIAEFRDRLGIEFVDFPDLDKLNDFENLAALLTCLDLFIGTGTTTTEFSAMLGVPTIYAAPTQLNAYRNEPGSLDDLYFGAIKMVRPIPASNRLEMMDRIEMLLREAVAEKSKRS